MSVLSRLLKVGSMVDSLGVYVPAMVLQKAMGLARLFFFIYMLHELQHGLWGLGAMIFTMAAPLLTLGSNHGLVRYVSFYEVRGRLSVFYRKLWPRVLAMVAALAVVAFLAGKVLTDLLIVSRTRSSLGYSQQLWICYAAIANAMLMALYHNMLGFMYGMRAYRLVAVVELFFGIVLTVMLPAALLAEPTALTALWVHLAAVAAALAGGMTLLHIGVTRLTDHVPVIPDEGLVMEVDPAGEEITGAVPESPMPADTPEAPEKNAFERVLKFGSVAMIATLLWHGVGFVSFWLTNRFAGTAKLGVFRAFLMLGQSVIFIANSAWAVIFSHVARRWENDDRKTALFTLQAAYKAVALIMMTLTITVYVSAPLWVRILPVRYRDGLPLLGGLLMFFQGITHLSIMTIIAKLQERPYVIALASLAAGAANVLLALWWMPICRYAPAGASWAAGVGLYVGAGLVTLLYFYLTDVKLSFVTHVVMVLPVMLLMPLCLPVWVLAVVWMLLLAVAVGTPWCFQPDERRVLAFYIVRTAKSLKRVFS